MFLSSLAAQHRPHALNALFEALGTVVVPNSCDVVVLAGPLSVPRLRDAIGTTLARHPVLRDRPFELRCHALPDADPARVDAHLLDLIWSERFRPDAAPVRFHVTTTPRRTYLQTIHTHVHADATACYLLTEEIAATYGGQMASAPPPTAGPDARLRRALERARPLVHHLRAIAQTARDVRAPFAGLATAAPTSPGRRRLARAVLDPPQTDQLRRAARARGCSIHAFFQLAFLRTAMDVNGRRGIERPRLRLWDFFSLRPLRDDAAGRYDCLALVYPVELDGRWFDEEVLARCTRAIEQLRDGEILTHAARFDTLLAVFGGLLPRPWLARVWPALFKTNVILTNPGVCPSPLTRFGDTPVVDYVTFPQLFHPAEVMLVFSTFRGSLRILAIYDEDAFGASFHHELFAPFVRAIGQLGGLDLSSLPTRGDFVAGWADASVDRRISA